MNRLVTLSLAFAVLSSVACTNDEPAESAEPVVAEPSAVQEGAPEEKERPKTMKEVVEAVTTAALQSKEAETGDTVCERAYSGQTAMTDLMMKALGSTKPTPKADRDAFIELCESAPPEVQNCLVPSYTVEHRDECREAKEKAGPEFAAKMKELSKKSAKGAESEPAETP
jgi:hypothetical protein